MSADLTELWTGTIDSLLDASLGGSGHYARIVVSATRSAAEADAPQQAADDADEGRAERIVVRDRDCIPLPHIGMSVVLRLERDRRAPSTNKVFFVRRCVFFRALAHLTRGVYSRAVCSGLFLCRARQQRAEAKAAGKPLDGLRDVPLSADATKFVTALTSRSTSELETLVGAPSVHSSALFAGLVDCYVARHLHTRAPLAALAATLRGRALFLPASAIADCSLRRLRALPALLEPLDPLSALLPDSAPFLVRFAPTTLAQPLYVVSSPVDRSVIGPRGRCLRQALDPLDGALGSSWIELRRSQPRSMRELLAMALALVPPANEVLLERAAAAHLQRCLAQQRYGRTVFQAQPDARTLLSLGAWCLLPLSRGTAAQGLADYTTAQCASRARQLAAVVASFESTTLALVEGGSALLSDADLAAVLGPHALVVSPHMLVDARTPDVCTLDDLLAGDDWTVRVQSSVASTLVLWDAHLLTELDMLNALLAFAHLSGVGRAVALGDEVWERPRLVLVGDVNQPPPCVRCAGAPFADLAACGRYAVETLEADVVRQHAWTALSVSAHFSLASAEVLVDDLLRARRSDNSGVASALRGGRQLVVWVPTRAALAAYMTFSAQLLPMTQDVNLSPQGREAEQALCAALDRLASYPHMTRNTVLRWSPFVLYRGATVRVTEFLRVVAWPARGSLLNKTHHCALLPAATTLVALDAANLVLVLADESADHGACCNTDQPNLMRVACHRRELRAASILTGREAAEAVRLSERAAFAVHHNAQRNGPLLDGARWNDTALSLARLPPGAEPLFLAHRSAGTNDALGTQLAAAFLARRRRPPTAFAQALK